MVRLDHTRADPDTNAVAVGNVSSIGGKGGRIAEEKDICTVGVYGVAGGKACVCVGAKHHKMAASGSSNYGDVCFNITAECSYIPVVAFGAGFIDCRGAIGDNLKTAVFLSS